MADIVWQIQNVGGGGKEEIRITISEIRAGGPGEAFPTTWRESKTVPVSSASKRKKFVLGAFNAGEHHIADAQGFAQKAGKNPQLWSDVQQFLEQASPKKEKAKEKAREIQQYVERVLLYEIEFTQKSLAGKNRKDKTAKKYHCTEGGHWVTIEDRPVYIC